MGKSRVVRRPHYLPEPLLRAGREVGATQRQVTHFRHCLASLRVEPSANCFMLKSVPPAEPSLQSPWRERPEPVGLRGMEAELGCCTPAVGRPGPCQALGGHAPRQALTWSISNKR